MTAVQPLPLPLRRALLLLDDVERARLTRSLATAADHAADRRQFRLAAVYRLLCALVEPDGAGDGGHPTGQTGPDRP